MKRAAIALLCITFAAILAPAVYSASGTITVGKEFALPSIDGRPFRPRISGDWVVAVRNSEKRAEKVVLINVPKAMVSTVFDIADGASTFPSVSGNMAVWTGKSDQIDSLRGTRGKRGQLPGSMILRDLTTGQYSAPDLSTTSAAFCSIDGNYVAYELGSRIYLYDLSNQQQKRISDDRACHSSPSIAGDLVVWCAKAEGTGKRQVYAYRIPTGVQTSITNDTQMDYISPTTDGRYIVWWTKADVYVYDTSTERTSTIPNAYFPSVDAGIVVYMKTGSRVYGMDLATREEFAISSMKATVGPDIDGGRVIWCSGNTIYCAELVHNKIQSAGGPTH